MHICWNGLFYTPVTWRQVLCFVIQCNNHSWPQPCSHNTKPNLCLSYVEAWSTSIYRLFIITPNKEAFCLFSYVLYYIDNLYKILIEFEESAIITLNL